MSGTKVCLVSDGRDIAGNRYPAAHVLGLGGPVVDMINRYGEDSSTFYVIAVGQDLRLLVGVGAVRLR
jgi:hypothetical protein